MSSVMGSKRAVAIVIGSLNVIDDIINISHQVNCTTGKRIFKAFHASVLSRKLALSLGHRRNYRATTKLEVAVSRCGRCAVIR